MLVSTLTVLATLLPALAASGHNPPPALRHRRLAESANHKARGLTAKPAHLAERANVAHAEAHRAIKKAVKKRDGQTCRARPSTSAANAGASASANDAVAVAAAASASATPYSAAAAPSSTWAAAASSADASPTVDNQQAWAQQASASPAPSASASSNGGGGVSVSVNVNAGSLLQITNGACGWCDSSDSQPNGSEDWLNCGLNSGGWNPPQVACSDLIAADLDGSGVFSPCSQYIDKFNQYAAEFGVHPIMLASFAMQESTCNAGAVGGNGEAGLMQIAPPNCEAGYNCWDPDYNIRRGAQLFSQMVSANGGNCIAAIGSYNGWSIGLQASSVWNTWPCSARQNMDYLYQFTNGWMQGQSGYNLGTINNLNC